MNKYRELDSRMYQVKDQAMKNFLSWCGGWTGVEDIVCVVMHGGGTLQWESFSLRWYNALCKEDKIYIKDCIDYIWPEGIECINSTDQFRFDCMRYGYTITSSISDMLNMGDMLEIRKAS